MYERTEFELNQLQKDIIRETLSLLTVEECISYNLIYGTTFTINDGRIVDFT